MKRLLVLLLTTLLAACATPYDKLRNYAGADSGTVVASVGMTSANTMNFAIVEFRRKGSADMGLLQFSPKALAAFGGTPTDFTSPAGAAVLVKTRLPPGEYEIFRYMSGADYGTSSVWFNAPENFAIPFTVKTGEVVYLGQYLVGLNLVGLKPASSFLQVTNEAPRDLAKLGANEASVRNAAEGIVKDAPSGVRRLN
ncbi:hypothetical protein [Mitsuaria sp. GD03876]|uniref:hypothetical protein n=1 Tax=Mitsuaria sp. GD03876 TaxID=2975399 RepID=UPI002447FCCA|nr:hypothetical protein [Mitsuaria sp. GD03876]MDH0863347.1 hypothetical protein [Mitsuaria sp. GD03876]